MELFTEELPLKVRVAMARHWVTGHALELSIGGQPDDNLPEQLHGAQSLITEDAIDIGIDAFATLSSETIRLMIDEVASECVVCPSCLADQVFDEAKEAEEEAE